MKTSIGAAAAAITLFASQAAHAQGAVQWKVSDGGNGHWYAHAPTTTGFAAEALATSFGGKLASISSSAENEFVRALLVASGREFVMLGLIQADNQPTTNAGWGWVSGEPLTYTNWTDFDNGYGFVAPEDRPCAGETPAEDNQCNQGLMYLDGRWDDVERGDSCAGFASSSIAVVEWSADCNNDGIVDYGQCRNGTLPDYDGNNIPDCCESGTPCVIGNYPVQWRVADGGNGHWYRFVIGQTISWDDARAAAVVRGGYLASVTSLEESDFVVGACSDTAGWIQFSYYWLGPWLGGYQPPNSTEPGGGWTWLSDEPWGWTRWWPASSEPNNGCSGHEDYLVMLTQSPLSGPSGWWNDAAYPDACGGPSPISYLVEWSADCNSDGVVDYGQVLDGSLSDVNDDGVPDICQQPSCVDADLFRDFNVNGADLGILLSQWGPNTPLTIADINNDGVVNGADLGILLSFWGACP